MMTPGRLALHTDQTRPDGLAAMRRARSADGPGHPNLTPMIDVVMCLIVFYLLVGQLASDQRSDLRLPSTTVGDAEPLGSAPFLNLALRNGQMAMDLDGVPIAPHQLAPALGAHRVVHLRADEALTYMQVAQVLQRLGEAGVRTVRIAAEQAGALAGGGDR